MSEQFLSEFKQRNAEELIKIRDAAKTLGLKTQSDVLYDKIMDELMLKRIDALHGLNVSNPSDNDLLNILKKSLAQMIVSQRTYKGPSDVGLG